MSTHERPRLSAEALQALLAEQFPDQDTSAFLVEEVAPMRVRARFRPSAEHVRPGNTVSGPALMLIADVVVYLAILAMAGPAVATVTTNLNIHFLRRPKPVDVLAEARLLRLGGRSAVGEVHLFSDGEDEPVAMATVSYALPSAP
jgi:acyl-coenzyme A thioesterase PaaI-like protein